MPFEALVDEAGDAVLVALSGEFGLEAARRFEDMVAEIARRPVRELTVDLSGIVFIDSTGVLMLIDLFRRFSGSARVTFEGATPPVQRRFESVGMGSLLTMPSGGGPGAGGVHVPGPEHDVTATPGHPHHPHPYIGLPHPELPPRRRP